MFFDTNKKKIAGSIIDHFDSKLPREKSGKMDFKEAAASKMAEGGEVDGDHDSPYHAIASDMIDAFHAKDAKALHESMKSYLEQHELESNQDPKDEGSEDKEND